ncbi:hypothetical protein SAMN05519103_06915 [Rhizobiales bacterium GAS113]|nr:hypothetical protein SAMN05519103_06915 [Rhizobiales bacterium GAS113]
MGAYVFAASKWLLAIAVAVYGLIVAGMYIDQRDLVFDLRPDHIAPAEAGFPEAHEHILATDDGEHIVAWLRRPDDPQRPLFLTFLGKGDNLGVVAPRLREMTADGSGLLALGYRGYSGSTGSPSEGGLMLDAEAAYRFAASIVPSDRIVLFGYSLGTGVAVKLATRHHIAALILFAPFTSAVAVAAANLPLIPVRLLMRDQFRSIEVIGKVAAPILVVHGERDETIPITFGRELFAAAPEPKRFVALPQADHGLFFQNDSIAAIRVFLDEFGLR